MPTEGIINLGGYDIQNIPAQEFRSYVGYCPQKVQLFTGTVYENITAGFENVSEEEVIKSATLACSHDFIAKLPGGYNYVQEQWFKFVRRPKASYSPYKKLIRKPKVLVLDETLIAQWTQILNYKLLIILCLWIITLLLEFQHIGQNHLIRTDKIGILVDGNKPMVLAKIFLNKKRAISYEKLFNKLRIKTFSSFTNANL